MKQLCEFLVGLGLVAVLALAGGPGHAQSIVLPGTGDADAKAQDAQVQLADLEAQRGRLRERAAEWKTKADAYEQAQEDGTARLEEIAREIEELERAEPISSGATPNAELEVLVLSAEQDLALAQREAADLVARLDRRSERRRQLPELLADVKSRLSTLEQAPPITLAEDDAIADLQQQVAAQRKIAIGQEVRSYELELATYESRGKVLAVDVERARLRVAGLESRLEQLREALATRREGEAELEAERALASISQVRTLDPAVQEVVRQLAQENADLARGRTGEEGLLQVIDGVSRKLTRADQRVSDVEADLARLAFRVESGGLSDSVGLLLRKTRSEVPDIGKYHRFIRMRRNQIAEVQTRQVELREELASVGKIDAHVDATVASLEGTLSEADRDRLSGVLRDLLETKRKHLNALLDDHEVYFQKLVDFDARQQELIEKTNALLLFIDQRVLWVPSGDTIHPRVLADGFGGLRWLSTPKYWGQLSRAVGNVFRETLYMSALGLLLLVVATPLLTRRIRPRLAELAAEARLPSCVDVGPTLECLALSLLLVPWGAGVLLYLGWRLGISPDATQFVRCMAHGLTAAGWIWLSLELPRQLLRRNGLGEAHFTWPDVAVRRLRREIGLVAAFAVPLVFAIQVFEMRGEDLWRDSLGRLALTVLLMAVAVITHWMLRAGGSLREILRATPGIRPGNEVWRMVHILAVGAPLALGVAAARGYYWTVLQLGTRYHLTLLFLLMILFVFQLSLRWSLVARRRIAFRLQREAREAERAERTQPDTLESSGERSLIPEEDLDLDQVDEQTGRLLATSAVVALIIGLWILWVDLVPAVGILDGVELWTTTESVVIETTAADGSRLFESENRTVPVTVANLLLAAVFAFMTLVLVRNLPGLLEISLFRHLGTATGERYAYTTIVKYTVTLIGGVLAFNAVGVGWSNIQWLVAAVGLGLGFGLQEIFANFVAGLIILFERPIRVGDTVTVGEISGTVTKIRIRATWITSFDRKELVVPNKEFVTTQLVNWSLSDPILRVDVPVGIAYGSDTELTIRELHAVALANDHILKEPRPDVLFLGFGDSTLDFELRVYSPDIAHRLPIVHSLHLEIDRAFRAAGIEIAFPQRDLHIRSTPPGATFPSSPAAPSPSPSASPASSPPPGSGGRKPSRG